MASWETRPGGRRYLYRTVRRAGRVARLYVGRDGELGALQAEWERIEQDDRAAARRVERARRSVAGWRVAPLLKLADGRAERDAAEALLAVIGFRRHKRGEWRMAGGVKGAKKRMADLEAEVRRPTPLVLYTAPAGQAEAAALFAAARAGDRSAVDKLPELIRARGWAEWIGDIGRAATRELELRISRDDPVLLAGLEAKVRAMWRELAGPSPATLELLLVRRIVNAWLALHAVEIDFARRTDEAQRARVEALLGKAERRMTSAIRELAVVRRLQAPALLARIELAAANGPAVRAALPAAGRSAAPFGTRCPAMPEGTCSPPPAG